MARFLHRFRWPLALASLALAGLGVGILVQPQPVFSSDVPGLFCLAGGLAGLALTLGRGRRHWLFWAAGVHAGLVIAVLFLAYKDAPLEEARARGVMIVVDVLLHSVLAPLEVVMGFGAGFVQEGAGTLILVCAALGLAGAELVRRRLWPRLSGVTTSVPE